MQKCVTVLTTVDLASPLLELLKSPEARSVIGACFPFDLVTAIATPETKDVSLADAVRDATICLVHKPHYLVYIGEDVMEKTEGPYGVLLPATTMNDKQLFREDVLYKIRKFVGSPVDN